MAYFVQPIRNSHALRENVRWDNWKYFLWIAELRRLYSFFFMFRKTSNVKYYPVHNTKLSTLLSVIRESLICAWHVYELARKGSKKRFIGLEPMLDIPVACARNNINGWVSEAHNLSWLTVRGCRWSKLMVPEIKLSDFLLTCNQILNRYSLGINYVAFRGALRYTLYKIMRVLGNMSTLIAKKQI